MRRVSKVEGTTPYRGLDFRSADLRGVLVDGGGAPLKTAAISLWTKWMGLGFFDRRTRQPALRTGQLKRWLEQGIFTVNERGTSECQVR